MSAMNQYQKVMLRTYAGGDYAHLIEAWGDHRRGNERAAEWLDENGGDTTALSLFYDLAPDGDTDKAEYIKRLVRDIAEIQAVIVAIEALPE